MEVLIFFIFTTFGLVEIIMKGKPAAPVRWVLRRVVGEGFIRCPLCLGFWCGAICGFFLYDFPTWFFCPLAGAGACYFLHALVNPLGDFPGGTVDENEQKS